MSRPPPRLPKSSSTSGMSFSKRANTSIRVERIEVFALFEKDIPEVELDFGSLGGGRDIRPNHKRRRRDEDTDRGRPRHATHDPSRNCSRAAYKNRAGRRQRRAWMMHPGRAFEKRKVFQ